MNVTLDPLLRSKRPEDWDDIKKIPDPDATKPVDWDEDTPIEILDEEARSLKDG